MSTFSERYSTNKSQEEDGTWVDFGDGIKVKIRRMNSKFSRDVRTKLEKPFAKQFRGQDYPLEIQDNLFNMQLAKAIVIEWEGVEDPNDPKKKADNSEDTKIAVFKKWPDFREDIAAASMERATFQDISVKEAEGNSKPSSDGT
jgi:hypothetical protein